jgi:predicted HNH restriction endonuclease
MLRICKHHGETEFREQSSNGKTSWYCVTCYVTRQKKNRKEKKRKAVEHMGGKCSICGYDKCMDALEFHHVNPEEKEVPTRFEFRTQKWETIVEELKKCIVLCSNCHREVHASMLL